MCHKHQSQEQSILGAALCCGCITANTYYALQDHVPELLTAGGSALTWWIRFCLMQAFDYVNYMLAARVCYLLHCMLPFVLWMCCACCIARASLRSERNLVYWQLLCANIVRRTMFKLQCCHEHVVQVLSVAWCRCWLLTRGVPRAPGPCTSTAHCMGTVLISGIVFPCVAVCGRYQ
jgi:hypothetical protein